jgi:hypothetical protein
MDRVKPLFALYDCSRALHSLDNGGSLVPGSFLCFTAPTPLGLRFFSEFFSIFVTFVLFVPLAGTINEAPQEISRLSCWLNDHLLGSDQNNHVSTFIWLLGILLFYDLLWFAARSVQWLASGRPSTQKYSLRVFAFWALLNSATLSFCAITVLYYESRRWDLGGIEEVMLFVIIPASLIDISGTIIEGWWLNNLFLPTVSSAPSLQSIDALFRKLQSRPRSLWFRHSRRRRARRRCRRELWCPRRSCRIGVARI